MKVGIVGTGFVGATFAAGTFAAAPRFDENSVSPWTRGDFRGGV
jgi:predicted dehydrogenase